MPHIRETKEGLGGAGGQGEKGEPGPETSLGPDEGDASGPVKA